MGGCVSGAEDFVGELMGDLMDEDFADRIPWMAGYQVFTQADFPALGTPVSQSILEWFEAKKGLAHSGTVRRAQDPQRVFPFHDQSVENAPFQFLLKGLFVNVVHGILRLPFTSSGR